jgi:hypothetical protein
LQSLIPDAEFIFKGEILNQNKIFSFYNIQSEDVIVALPKRRSDEVTRWTQITQNYDEFQESMGSAMGRETARLRDLSWIRRERGVRFTKRMLNYEVKDNRVMMSEFPTVIPPPPTKMSDTPLPVWWENDSK